MPFASTSRSAALKARTIPLATAATALSISLYSIHAYLNPTASSIKLDSDPFPEFLTAKKPNIPVSTANPFVPLGWGSNRFLTLYPDPTLGVVKRPKPLLQLGATPLRDLVLAEKYGAAVDAKGDCWMWGIGYDQSGEIGRSLKGKNVKTLAPGPAKLFALSKDGRLYVVSASRALQANRLDKSEQSWWSWLFSSDSLVDHIELSAEGGLKRGEKWVNVSVGTHHLLAVTTKGRTFSLPLSPSGNSHRQLGTRQNFDQVNPLPSPGVQASLSEISKGPEYPPESDPRFAKSLIEIPSLSGIQIEQIATSDRSSFVRTPNGRVLGFGANEVGQIGLGANGAVEIVPVPVEIVLAKNYPGGTTLRCLDVQAGGTTTMFVVERDVPGREGRWVDLLACGNGISGALGNGLYSSASPVPVKVKTVSGLTEFSEKDNALIPLGIHSVAVSRSPNSHIVAVLDTSKQADTKGVKSGLYGKDVMVWGGNVDYQLGNGKRSSLAVPQHLPILIARDTEELTSSQKEAELSSGTLSPMPHSRLQLHQSKADAYDLDGKLIKRNVKCEEVVVAGYSASALYNKIIE